MRLLPAIILSLTLAACHPAAPIKNYPMRGVIVHVDAPAKAIAINAEKIADWMEPMTMDYPVHDPALLKGLAPGDHITATVHVKEDLTYWIDNIAK